MPTQAKRSTSSQLLSYRNCSDALKAQTHRGSISKATTLRRRSHITSAVPNSSQQRCRSLRLQGADPIQTTSGSVQQAKTRKRPREDEIPPSSPSLEPFPKRVRTSVSEPLKPKTISEARVDYWRETGAWPTEEQEGTMDRFRELVDHARARKRSLSRKRSNASLASETTPTQMTSSMSRDQKCAPYRHPLFQR